MTLKVGSSTIVIDPTSITLNATTIKVEAGAQGFVKAPDLHVQGDITEVKGGMVTVNGSGTLVLQGGVVNIN